MKKLVLLFLLAFAGASYGDDLAAKKQTCVEAMNADPAFAKSIVETADKGIDARTIEAHNDAFHHIQKNEAHVIYAYAAMWVIAAAFLLFMWRRQQSLRSEIAHLRADLAAAAKDSK